MTKSVFFLPENREDLASPEPLIAQLNSDRGRPVAFNVGEADLNWDRYNLKPASCHPSPYGQQAIAEYVAERIEPAALKRQEPLTPISSILGTPRTGA